MPSPHAGRAPGACRRRRASRSTSRAASTRSPRPTPCSSPGCAPRGGRRRRGARCAARGPRPRRARGLDLHRAPSSSRTPACSTAAGPRRTGPMPTRLAGATRRSPSIPGSSTSTRATCSPRPASRAGIDLCLHLVRRDHGAEVGQRGRAADRRGARIATAARRSSSRRRCPRRASAASRPRARGRGAPARAAHGRRDGAPRRCSERTFARRFLAETGTTPLQWLLASASCTPAACWRRPTSRSRTSPATPGSARPPRCARISAARRRPHRSRIAAASGVVRRNGYHPQRGAGHPRRRQHRRPARRSSSCSPRATGWRSRR